MPPPRRLVARAIAGLVVVVVVLVVGTGPVAAQPGERIRSYSVELRIDESGALAIREVIHYDFASNERHGILRDVPVRLRYDDRFDRVYPLEVVSVEASSGAPANYVLEEGGGTKRIRIGDPDRTITGAHTYTIAYRMEAALNAFPDHDELYWNAIGAQWDVPIDEASVTVAAPAGIRQVACFTGPTGSNLPCASSTSEGATARFAQRDIGAFEALTVVVAIPTGVVPRPTPRLEERWTLARAFSVTPATVASAGALLVAVLAGFVALVWNAGRDRRFTGLPIDAVFGEEGDAEAPVPLTERPVTPVEYLPPDGVRPGQVGTLVDEHANPLDVVATIVDLAVRGHLRIDEIPKKWWLGKPDWTLVRLEKDRDGLLHYEKRLLDGLFESSSDGEVKLSDLKNTFATRLRRVQDALYDDVVARKWFRTRPDHVRLRWAVIGGVVTAAGAGLVYLAARSTTAGLVPVPLVIGGLLLAAGSRWMPRRTAKGTAALRRVAGFRRFIEDSEKERARFAERRHLFSEYLPYAIVFGATEKWAKAFAGLDGELPEMSWYGGRNSFTASSFSSSMDGFAITTAGTIASTPSGSGSSGFSGGSSGGGGGGGGGGSW